MLGVLHHRGSTGDGGFRVDQLGRAVGGAARVAVVTVLLRGLALGAGTLDEAVRQEHGLFRIEQLGDGADLDLAGRLEAAIDKPGQLAVLVAVGRVIVVEADVEAGKIPLMLLGYGGDHLLGSDPHLLRLEHDGGTVRVIGTDEMHLMATHSLITNPDIGLDVFQHVAKMDGAVGIGEGAGYQHSTRISCHNTFLMCLLG
ncbi:hypothetical protein D3C75_401660 [compost metagenome]